MCTRCGIIREGNLLYARRRFVDAIGYTDRVVHVSRNVWTMSFFIINFRSFRSSTLEFHINNISKFLKIFFTHLFVIIGTIIIIKLVFERGRKKEKDHRKDIRFINETRDEFRDFIRADSCQNSSLCLLGIGFYVIRVETRCIHLARRAPRRNDRLWRGHCCLLSDECLDILPKVYNVYCWTPWFNGTVPSRVVKIGKIAWNYFTKYEAYLFYIHGSLNYNWLISRIIQFCDFYLLFYYIYI